MFIQQNYRMNSISDQVSFCPAERGHCLYMWKISIFLYISDII